MPTLFQSLQNRDLGHLRIVAQFWGIELDAGERKTAHKELSEKLLDAELAEELLDTLPDDASQALQALTQNKGKVTWATFERQFGSVREAGPGRRDREKLHLNPISAAEKLFYRALLARAFFETENGALEFAYIPSDLLKFIPSRDEEPFSPPQKQYGRLARPEERTHIIPSNDHILDDMTTLLAALRTGKKDTVHPFESSPRFVRDLSLAAHLMGKKGGLQRDAVKTHLEQDRAAAFAQLRKIWRKSTDFNELHLVPSLICEGEWTNPSLETREKLLGFIDALPKGKWWHLNSFIADIKTQTPDFQRTAGEYDAWFIRRAEDETPLRGFEHWDDVEGALIRYFLTGILFWLGYVDLAASEKDGEVRAFLIKENTVSRSETKGQIIVSSNGLMTVERHASRAVRYQLARFGEWVKSKNPNEFKYQITTSSLEQAQTQGLKVTHLVGLLAKFSETKIPPSLGKALRRWEVSGTEARVRHLTVLRLSKPDDLEALRKSRASRFLGTVLNPTTVQIKEGASQKVMAALIEMGILMEDEASKM